MFPTLYDFGLFTLPSYVTMMALGFVVAILLVRHEGKRIGLDPEDIFDLGLYAVIFGLGGAKVLHVLADGLFWDYVHICTDPFLVEGRDLWGRPISELTANGLTPRLCTTDLQCFEAMESGRLVGGQCDETTGYCHPEQDCFRWAYGPGFVFLGGLIACLGFAVHYVAKYRVGMLWAPKIDALAYPKALASIPLVRGVARTIKYTAKFPQGILKLLDAVAPALAIAHGLGRVGCFLSGCCFGEVHDGPLAVQFPGGSSAYQEHRETHFDALMQQTTELGGEHLSLPVHPTQLYSAGALFAIAAILWFVVRRNRNFHGQVFAWYLGLYGLARFSVEFLRADDRGALFGLSTAQWIAVPMMLGAIWLIKRGSDKSNGQIDDGANPPLGKPLHETMHQAEEVRWDGVKVSPIPSWPERLETLMEHIKAGRSRSARRKWEAEQVKPETSKDE